MDIEVMLDGKVNDMPGGVPTNQPVAGANVRTFLLDGKVPPGVNEGVPGTAAGKLLLPAEPPRPVLARFNDETIAVQTWPAKDNHIVVAEFHY